MTSAQFHKQNIFHIINILLNILKTILERFQPVASKDRSLCDLLN